MSITAEAQRWLKSSMNEILYSHSVACSELAMEIARKYGANVEETQLAALIHDCGKIYSPKELQDFVNIYGIKLDEIEKANPSLIHALVSAEIFESKFGKLPDRIKKAVRLHTTGDANMSLLDKIIYIADSLEPNRHFPGLVLIREKIHRDLDYTLYLVIQRKIQHTMEKRVQIHPRSIEAWNHVINLVKTKKY